MWSLPSDKHRKHTPSHRNYDNSKQKEVFIFILKHKKIKNSFRSATYCFVIYIRQSFNTRIPMNDRTNDLLKKKSATLNNTKKILMYLIIWLHTVNLTDDAHDFIFQLSSWIRFVGVDPRFKISPQKEVTGEGGDIARYSGHYTSNRFKNISRNISLFLLLCEPLFFEYPVTSNQLK